MLIPIYNPEVNDYEKTYLANPYAIGTTSIEVKNSDRLAANYRVMLGEMGQEKTEIVSVSSVNANGTTVVIGATVFEHSANDPVTVMQFDQVKYYRSTTGATGSYSLLTTVNLDVDNENLQTIYDDVSGLSTYYYKVSMYHSVSTVESSLSDPIPGGGFKRSQVGYIINEILQEVSDQNEVHVTRNELIGYFNDVNDDLTTNVGKPYSFLHARTTLTRTLGRSYIDFPTDSNGDPIMWKFDRMDYNFTDPATSPITDTTSTILVLPMDEFRNIYSDNTISTTTETDATPQAMALDTSVNRFRFSAPFLTTGAGVFYLHYWKFFDQIDTEGDQIETPTPKIYKLYCKSMYYRKRAVTESSYSATADRYAADYQIEKNKYKAVDRLDRGTSRSFRPQSSTNRIYQRY